MKITVFTPTYNRGYIIEKLYRSLQKQTINSFEWLVIDDGSTDETEKLFNKWQKEANLFQIRYLKVENGGKHRAINKASDIARGELFFIVDSDDQITEDALENIIKWEESIKGKRKYCGIAGNRGRTGDQIIGTTFKGSFVDATSLERNKYNITGDKAEVFYTHILKNYKFDEIQGENFITEATVWDRMAYDGYKIRWFNITIYICDYLEDGLTTNMRDIFARNPIGTAIYINQQIEFYKCNIRGKMAYYNLYYEHVKKRVKLKSVARYMNIQPVTLIFSIFACKLKKQIFKNWR